MSARASRSLAALAASACTWGGPPAPALDGAIPVQVTRGATAVLVVTGAGFQPDVVVDFDDPSRSEVCAAIRMELRSAGQVPVSLEDPRIVSGTELRARIPAVVGKDLWDVVVVDAAGREAVLPGALDVVGCTPPNSDCSDGDSCTFVTGSPEDRCTGAAACIGGEARADGTPCTFECTTGEGVEGACGGGRCLPLAGRCEPAPTCGGAR